MTAATAPARTKCVGCGNPSWDPWSSWCEECRDKPTPKPLPSVHQLREAFTELPSFTAGKVMPRC